MFWSASERTGWFGWFPSNGGRGVFVIAPIDSLAFEVTFHDVYGVDESGAVEGRLRGAGEGSAAASLACAGAGAGWGGLLLARSQGRGSDQCRG